MVAFGRFRCERVINLKTKNPSFVLSLMVSTLHWIDCPHLWPKCSSLEIFGHVLKITPLLSQGTPPAHQSADTPLRKQHGGSRVEAEDRRFISKLLGIMLKSKVFVKKTRKGGIMKVVREHYLRDDVWCGASHCTNCAQADDGLLDSTPLSCSKLCSFPHYLLLDTNVVLHQVNMYIEL